MKSLKLLAAAAIISAFVAGPVLAQEETMEPVAPASDAATTASSDTATTATTPAKHVKKHAAKKHHVKKHHAKKAKASTSTEGDVSVGQ